MSNALMRHQLEMCRVVAELASKKGQKGLRIAIQGDLGLGLRAAQLEMLKSLNGRTGSISIIAPSSMIESWWRESANYPEGSSRLSIVSCNFILREGMPIAHHYGLEISSYGLGFANRLEQALKNRPEANFIVRNVAYSRRANDMLQKFNFDFVFAPNVHNDSVRIITAKKAL